MRRDSVHIESITLVAHQLSKLKTEMVFTGGAVVGLLLTDVAPPDVRPTDDVDVIAAITRYSEYASLSEELRKLGFKHDMNGPNCRFILQGLTVDIMPIEGKILGFSNRWYDLAIKSAKNYLLPDGTSIRLISAPVFIATKLEAFQDRGNGDYILSHDMEDIIAVVNGREELLDEIKTADGNVRKFICDSLSDLVNDREFVDAINTYLLPDEGSQARKAIIINRLRAISELGK